jgi:hypothetical protein
LLADGAALFGGTAPNLLLDRVETGNALQDLVADGRASFRNCLDDFAPAVAPTIGEPQRRAAPAVGPLQPIVAGKAIDLQYAVKADEHLFGMPAAAPGRVVKHHARRIGAAERTIGGLVHEQLAGTFERLGHPLDDGRQMKSARPTQSAKVERSMPTPWRTKTWAWR